MKKPDQQVAERILTAFQKEGLLRQELLKDLEQRIAAGQMSSHDWTVLFKLNAIDEKGSDEHKA